MEVCGSQMERKEKRGARTAQSPPPEPSDLNPLAMAGKIAAVEPRVVAKLLVTADASAMRRVAAEMGAGEPHSTESQEEAQTCEGTAMACVKWEKKGEAGPDLHEPGQRLGLVLNLLGQAQWKDEITRGFKIEAAERLHEINNLFNLMGQAQTRWRKSYVSRNENYPLGLMGQARLLPPNPMKWVEINTLYNIRMTGHFALENSKT